MSTLATTRPGGASAFRIVTAFAAMAMIYFFSYFLRAGIPGTIFNELQADLAMSASAVAALGSIYIFVYACIQPFVGLVADRFGGTRSLMAGGIIMGLGAVLFPLASSLWVLYLARGLTGFGAGFVYLSLLKEIDPLFGARRFPMITGVVLASGYAGGIAAMLPFERLVTRLGWRPVLLGVALAILASLGCAHLLLRRLNHAPPRRTRMTLWPMWEVLRNPPARPQFLCGFINFPVYFVIQATLGKKFLQDVAGLDSASAALFTTVMMAVSAGLALAGGLAPAWCGHRRKPILVVATATILLATLLLLAGVLCRAPGWVFLVVYVLLALPSGAGPAAVATMKEVSHPERTALAVGIINGLTYLGVAAFMTASGAILDAFRLHATLDDGGAVIYPPQAYATVFAWLAGMALISLVSSTRIPETRGLNTHALPAPL